MRWPGAGSAAIGPSEYDRLIGMTRPAGPANVIRPEGPWTHRDVAANGARFHIAEVGDGPLVLLLHGFPQFWWTWRHQLTALAEAGFRAVAMDLRGVGGSDRTPRGYDPANLALDVTGVDPLPRRAGRGAGRARPGRLSGVDGGGDAARSWSAASRCASMPHPRRWRSAMLSDVAAERRRVVHLGLPAAVGAGASARRGRRRRWSGKLIRDWSGPRLAEQPDAEDAVASTGGRCCIPSTAHCSIEPYRWMVRRWPGRTASSSTAG